MKLRPYQDVAIARVLELFARLVRRVLLVLPTGGGKTVIASAIIFSYLLAGKRVLMLAHRRELIKQAFCKLVRNGIGPDQIGIIMAGTPWKVVDAIAPDPATLTDDELWRLYARRRPGAPIQVGSIDTFRNHVAPPADLVIVDEAHRALAKSYCDVQLAYPHAHHLGLTATPFRADGKGLSDAYDDLVVAASFAELVDEGFLVAPFCYGSKLKADLSGVRKSKGDYNEAELAAAVDRSELVGDIVEHWIRRGNGLATFAFAINVQHSKHLAERFNAAGIPARHVDGNTETSERDDSLAALRAGTVKVLTNCNVFTEGTDVPEVKTIILARPTLSEGLYLQQAGRGARPFEDQPFVILDHAGCCSSPLFDGLPQDPRAYSLEGRKKRDKTTVRLPPVKDCPECCALVGAATRVCPGCGYVWPAEEPSTDPPKEAAGELVLLNPQKLTKKQQERLDEWNEIVSEWEQRNRELDARGERLLAGGWCTNQWRNRSGQTWPPKGSKIPKLTPEQLEANASRGPTKRDLPRGFQVPLIGDDPGRSIPGGLEEWAL